MLFFPPDEEEEEGLLPQLANPPFEDENKPLVLEEGGEGQAVVQVGLRIETQSGAGSSNG